VLGGGDGRLQILLEQRLAGTCGTWTCGGFGALRQYPDDTAHRRNVRAPITPFRVVCGLYFCASIQSL
jgi:hypothetical protein